MKRWQRRWREASAKPGVQPEEGSQAMATWV